MQLLPVRQAHAFPILLLESAQRLDVLAGASYNIEIIEGKTRRVRLIW